MGITRDTLCVGSKRFVVYGGYAYILFYTQGSTAYRTPREIVGQKGREYSQLRTIVMYVFDFL